jgi:hypothetical protein
MPTWARCFDEVGRWVAAVLVGAIIVGPILETDAWARKRRRARVKTTIEVLSMTRGAQVFIDDKLIGTVPLPAPIAVKPGRPHTVRVKKRGYIPFIDTIRLKRGDQHEMEADLIPSGGVLQITSNIRRAQVLLDGKPLGRTPFDGDITPGKHTLQVVAPGKLQDTRVISLRAGQTLLIKVELRDVPPPIIESDDSLLGQWWFWTAVGATVVGGVALGVLTQREVEVTAESQHCAPSCHTITVGGK